MPCCVLKVGRLAGLTSEKRKRCFWYIVMASVMASAMRPSVDRMSGRASSKAILAFRRACVPIPITGHPVGTHSTSGIENAGFRAWRDTGEAELAILRVVGRDQSATTGIKAHARTKQQSEGAGGAVKDQAFDGVADIERRAAATQDRGDRGSRRQLASGSAGRVSDDAADDIGSQIGLRARGVIRRRRQVIDQRAADLDALVLAGGVCAAGSHCRNLETESGESG